MKHPTQQVLDDLDPEERGWFKSYLDLHARLITEYQQQIVLNQGYAPGCVCGSCGWCIAQDIITPILPRN
jgi:hypothetical protein